MKFNIKINGIAVSREIPNAWHLVTFRQFLKLAECGDDMSKVIGVFTGLDPELLRKADIKNYDVLMSCISFMKSEMNMIIPSACLGMKVPSDIESEAIARYADVQSIVQQFKEGESNIVHYPLIAATYITPSPYDFKQAEQLAERLLDAPCAEVMAIGNFTLRKLIASRNGTLNSSHLEGTLRNRLKRGIVLWLNRLAFSIRYHSLRR